MTLVLHLQMLKVTSMYHHTRGDSVLLYSPYVFSMYPKFPLNSQSSCFSLPDAGIRQTDSVNSLPCVFSLNLFSISSSFHKAWCAVGWTPQPHRAVPKTKTHKGPAGLSCFSPALSTGLLCSAPDASPGKPSRLSPDGPLAHTLFSAFQHMLQIKPDSSDQVSFTSPASGPAGWEHRLE